MHQINDRDLANVMIFALRYAIPRRSYVVQLVQDLIKEHQSCFSNFDFEQMMADINYERNKLGGTDWAINDGWNDFYEWLEKQRKV